MTIEELNKCKRDDQGRPMVKDGEGNEFVIAVATPDTDGHLVLIWTKCSEPRWVGHYCFGVIDTLTPVPAHPHAELVERLGRVEKYLNNEGFGIDAVTIREAAALIEKLGGAE